MPSEGATDLQAGPGQSLLTSLLLPTDITRFTSDSTLAVSSSPQVSFRTLTLQVAVIVAHRAR